MPTVSGQAAIDNFRTVDSCEPGYCLSYVWRYGYKWQGAVAQGASATALDGWFSSDGKHENDWNPPAGVPVWLGAKRTSFAGDVVISLGNGRVRCTDWPYNGRIGECTIEERVRQTGRPYLGWTEEILGNPINYTTGSISGGGAYDPNVPVESTPSEEDDMTTLLQEKNDNNQGGRLFLLFPDGQVENLTGNGPAAELWRKVASKQVEVSGQQLDAANFEGRALATTAARTAGKA